jgi:hypothetical protein
MPVVTKAACLRALNNSFQPAEEIWVLRTYMRQRYKPVAGIHHIQKALTGMNISWRM